MLIPAIASLPQCGSGRAMAEQMPFSVVSVLVHERAFDRPHDIELQGGRAFVPGKGGSLAIVDVSRPQNPRLLWHRHDEELLHDAETVLPAGDWLFVGTDDFIAVDVRDAQHPVFGKRLSRPPQLSRINGLARRGDTILAASKGGFLVAFDIREPAAPSLAGVLNVRAEHAIAWPHDVDLFAGYAVVPDPQRFGRDRTPGKLALFRVFEKGAPRLLPSPRWKLAGVVATEELAGANRVQVSGHHAFVGASTVGEGGRLVVVDLRGARSPRQVASLPFAPHDGWGPNGLTVAGQVVFLAGGQSVEAVDVSRPDQPAKLASERFTKELSGGRDSGHDLVYRDGYLYVTGQNDHCLVILRVVSERIRQLAK
ncbi:MAG: LVIVD repeat-containing protein [Candidatus Brocadiia bacterium]